ncbi:MAG: hypothetical protein ABIO44_00065 [Saprospiraceae bacterium]
MNISKIISTIIILSGFWSCRDINDIIITSNIIDINYLNTSTKLKDLNTTASTFEFDASKGKVYTFSDNSRITFEPNSFVLNGSLIGSKIVKVVVKKILHKNEMLANGTTTNSDDKILESAGMFYIQAFYGDKELELASGSKYKIQIPTNKTTSSKMEMFYGKETDFGVNWTEADDNSNVQNNVFRSEWKVDSLQGYAIGIQCFPERLHWVNCDYFIENPSINSTKPCLEPDIAPNGDVIDITAYCVFKHLNIVLSPCCSMDKAICFHPLPVGEEVIYILIGKGKTNYYLGHFDKKIEIDEITKIKCEVTTLDEIKTYLAKL